MSLHTVHTPTDTTLCHSTTTNHPFLTLPSLSPHLPYSGGWTSGSEKEKIKGYRSCSLVSSPRGFRVVMRSSTLLTHTQLLLSHVRLDVFGEFVGVTEKRFLCRANRWVLHPGAAPIHLCGCNPQLFLYTLLLSLLGFCRPSVSPPLSGLTRIKISCIESSLSLPLYFIFIIFVFLF